MVAERTIAGASDGAAAGAAGTSRRQRRGSIAVVVLFVVAGCSRPPAPPAPDAAAASSPAQVPPAPSDPATFVNQVWQVKQSSTGVSGSLYVFLSDGTLLVTGPGEKPMVGSWSRSGEGLVMVEEGISYRVDILGLTPDSFSIRSHNPGEPVDIVLVRAPGS